MFRRADGGYESRDFVWSKENSTTASEPFQNGIDSIYYHLENNRIVVDYPDGWWPDRAYEWVSDVDGAGEYIPGVPVSYGGATVDFKEWMFEKSADEYDNELATLGAMLCMAAGRGEQEICRLFRLSSLAMHQRTASRAPSSQGRTTSLPVSGLMST